MGFSPLYSLNGFCVPDSACKCCRYRNFPLSRDEFTFFHKMTAQKEFAAKVLYQFFKSSLFPPDTGQTIFFQHLNWWVPCLLGWNVCFSLTCWVYFYCRRKFVSETLRSLIWITKCTQYSMLQDISEHLETYLNEEGKFR